MHGKMGPPIMMYATLAIVAAATVAEAEHANLPSKLDSMRVKDPVAVLGALRSLGLASDEDFGILNDAERGQMMDGLESDGISLGDRSKVRHHFHALVADYTTEGHRHALRRAQGGHDESATNKQRKKQVEDHAGTAQASGEQASGGISNDSVSLAYFHEYMYPTMMHSHIHKMGT
jgi:hypothetical protein